MPEEKKKLGEILLEAGVIDKFQLKSALAEQNKWGGRLGNHLVQMGILSEDLLVKALSKQLKIPNLDLAQMMVTADVLELVPHEIAEKFHLVPVAVKKIANKRTLIVAMSDPTNLDAVDELQFRTGHIIKPAVAGDTAIELAIRRYYYGELGPQRVAGQPIEFDPSRASATPEVTNVPTAGVPVPPENEFALGSDEPPPPAPQPEPEIPEASLADLGMEVQEPTAADAAPQPSVATAWPASEAPAAPSWSPPEEAAVASVEPEPYDPAVSPAEPAYAEPAAAYAEPAPEYAEPVPEPAYAEPTYAEPAADPAYAEPAAEPTYAEPAAEPAYAEPTVADPAHAEVAAEAAPLEPTYADPAAEAAPADAYAEPAPAEAAWNGGTAEEAWPAPGEEAPYPADEPTVPADDYAATAAAPVDAASYAEPAGEEPAWAEAAPAMETVATAADSPVADVPPAQEEPVWAEASAELAPPPAELSVVPPEPSMDSVSMEPVEPGPAEAEVDRMEEVGAAGWNAGDAVQTFLGSSDGHPYEPTTPGEPTHAPADEPALAADGGAAAAGEVTHVAEDVPPEAPHANGNGASADSTQPDYMVPADPLGGIPFDTAEGRAIRALCALLLEKGLLTEEELASRLRAAVEGMGGGDAGEGHG